jgi:hypothetical protein
MVARLPGSQPPVDLKPLDVLAGAAISTHDRYPDASTTTMFGGAALFRLAPTIPKS